MRSVKKTSMEMLLVIETPFEEVLIQIYNHHTILYNNNLDKNNSQTPLHTLFQKRLQSQEKQIPIEFVCS